MSKIDRLFRKRKDFFVFPTMITNQKGAVVVFVAVSLIALLAFTALAVDIGRYMITRNELQNISDSAALAACRVLGNIYKNLPSTDQKNYVCNDTHRNQIIGTAVTVGSKNYAGGLDNIVILPEDVIIGTWNANDDPPFNPTSAQPDAVRVIARRDASANNPITTFFASLVGIDTIDVSMDATAALTGQSTTEPGELELPIGISSYFFENDRGCNDFIVFNPTNDPNSCAGWNSYDISPPNDNLLRNILNGDPSSPATNAGETEFNFIGGNLSNPTFDALLSLFMRKGFDTEADGETPVAYSVSVDEDGNPIQIPKPGNLSADEYPGVVPIAEDGEPLYTDEGTLRLDEKGNPLEQAVYPNGEKRNLHLWETSVAVYGWDDCANPNTSITIVGYTKIYMTNVQSAPEKRIEGWITCDLFSNFNTRGGGGEFGIKGTIPGLVE